ncbi:unnamed protein product, partial [Allacma fusca]
MVHIEKKDDKSAQSASSNTVTVIASSCPASSVISTHVLLPTAIVYVMDSKGYSQSCRALLDSGSEVSFVSSSCVKRLGIPIEEADLQIHGVSAAPVGSSNGKVQLQVSSRIYEYATPIEAYILPRVTKPLPTTPVPGSSLNYIKGLRLADPFYFRPEDIDLLIGADVFSNILRATPVIVGPPGFPNAIDTEFGWVISGRYHANVPTNISSLHVHCELESILRSFWEIESAPSTASPVLSVEEQLCEQHYVQTHQRLSNGRYMLRLPFKLNTPVLGSSRDLAIRRLQAVERRLTSQPAMYNMYIDCMREYIRLGHMEKLPPNEVHSPSNAFYFPHHCVMKASSTTTKLRVVFDGSAKTSNGISLNETQMIGPKVHSDLLPILLRFRMWLLSILADAKMMYRQFLIHPEDRVYQRVVWRESPTSPIEDYALLTVTYGNVSAVHHANRTVQQLALDEKVKFPLASEVILRDAYVDDILSGADSLEDGLTLQKQLLQMFSSAKIELRKWTSNNANFLSHLPQELREVQVPFPLDVDQTVKSLGLQYSPATDSFTFSVVPPPNRKVSTKRTLLSDISKIFDPFGWLSPVTIKTKILFQTLWSRELSWDKPLPEDVMTTWTKYHQQLHSIDSIRIPRHAIL